MAQRKICNYMRMINVAGFAAILGVRLQEMGDIRTLPGFPRAELVEDDIELWGADLPLEWLEQQTCLMQMQLRRLERLLEQAKMATKQLIL